MQISDMKLYESHEKRQALDWLHTQLKAADATVKRMRRDGDENARLTFKHEAFESYYWDVWHKRTSRYPAHLWEARYPGGMLTIVQHWRRTVESADQEPDPAPEPEPDTASPELRALEAKAARERALDNVTDDHTDIEVSESQQPAATLHDMIHAHDFDYQAFKRMMDRQERNR